jgi:ABC-type phosphate/phosphonate transport system substrate-binding protein
MGPLDLLWPRPHLRAAAPQQKHRGLGRTILLVYEPGGLMTARAALLLSSLFASTVGRAPGQAPPLKAVFVSSIQTSATDDSLRALLGALAAAITSIRPGLVSPEVDLYPSNYSTPCNLLAENAVGTLTPLRYVECKARLGTALVPLFVVRKRHEPIAYYSAFFVVHRQSAIRSIQDTAHIRTLILVDSNSTSGFLYPLYRLYEDGLIRRPGIDAVHRLGWKTAFAGSQREAVALVQRDVSALAAVGGFPSQEDPANAPVRVLLRYATIPQDVLFMSANLVSARPAIEGWFENLLAHDAAGREVNPRASIMERSSSQLTGLAAFDAEYDNAYLNLTVLAARVRGTAPLPSLNLSSDIALGDLFRALRSMRMRTLLLALSTAGIIALFLIAIGHRFGGPILQFVGTVRSLWKSPAAPPSEPGTNPHDRKQ